MKFSLNSSTASALNLNRNVPAAREKLYKAFTEPSELSKWWLPEGAKDVKFAAKVKEDGDLTLSYQTPGGEAVTQTGTYRSVSKNEMLVFSLKPDSLRKAEPETLITVEFRKAESGTALAITHEGLPDAATQERYRKDWIGKLERLTRLVS